MKYIIIFEDEDRTLIFKSDDFEEVKNWFDKTRKNLFDKNYTEFYSTLNKMMGVLHGAITPLITKDIGKLRFM